MNGHPVMVTVLTFTERDGLPGVVLVLGREEDDGTMRTKTVGMNAGDVMALYLEEPEE